MNSSQRVLQTNGKLFQINGRKPKNIGTSNEAWIFIKVQSVIYQWICLGMLYKLMKAVFNFLNHIFFLNQLLF